ncbi:MAG: PD-(D/E)XK nuclease family protein [Bacteroidales bacterium]|nr:PD-(D/E)XK nuclease family protein [Bacteroidales bacterium]
MTTFLSEVAHYIYKYNTQFANVVVLMPNRRSCLYLEKELCNLLNHTSWLPQIISLNDWVNQHSSLQTADELLLISHLFKVFKNNYTNKTITFDEFYFTGQILLNDFNDLDAELVDAEKLFTNLADIKEISERFPFDDDFFNILKGYVQLLEKQNKSKDEYGLDEYLKLWQGFYTLYEQFKKELILSKIAYDGLLTRYFVENEWSKLNHFKDNIFFVVGFNAVNKAEKKIFELLNHQTEVQFLWDYDEYYIKNEQFHAGEYLRNLLKSFPPPKDFVGSFDNFRKQQIKIHALPNEVVQAKYACQCLSSNEATTGLILADESLLPVVLASLPENVTKVNVTMGFSVKYSTTYSFIRQLFRLIQQIRFVHDDIWISRVTWMELLYHPFLAEYKELRHQLDSLLNKNSNYQAYLSFKNSSIFQSNSAIEQLLYAFFKNIDHLTFIRQLLELLQFLEQKWLQKEKLSINEELEIQALRKVYNSLGKFYELLQQNEIEINDKRLLLRLIQQIIQRQKIDLFGEPLEGLQIMGLMESRLIDFEKVLVLSLNESVIPGEKFMPTFILHSLRLFFGMTTPERREAIDAYHFYRLLQRSKESLLFYSQFIGNDEADKSPYVRQLLFNTNISVEEFFIHDAIAKSDIVEPIIVNKKDIEEEWHTFLNSNDYIQLSQAALATYIQCPLKYYFERIKHLSDAQLFPDDNLDKKMGDIFHEALRKLFESYDFIEIKDLDQIQQKIPLVVDELVLKNFDLTWMQVLLMKEQLKNWLYKFIDVEKGENSHFPAKILGFEKDLNFNVQLSEKKILLFGRADFIIERDDALYIIDFKTGGEKDVRFNHIEDLFNQNAKMVYAFQLAFYGYLYSMDKNFEKPLYLENIYIKKYDSPFKKVLSKLELIQDVKGKKKPVFMPLNFNKNIVTEFEKYMINKINELFNENYPFIQTTDIQNCEYCNFNLICRKN